MAKAPKEKTAPRYLIFAHVAEFMKKLPYYVGKDLVFSITYIYRFKVPYFYLTISTEDSKTYRFKHGHNKQIIELKSSTHTMTLKELGEMIKELLDPILEKLDETE